MNRFRWIRLFVLLLLVGTILLVACGGEENTPSPTVTPTSTPVPTETPAPTATPAQSPTPSEVPRDSSLRVLSSRAASAPTALDPFRVGKLSLLPAIQGIGGAGGLTVSGNSSVTVEADEAYVVVIPGQRFGPSGPVPIDSDDRIEVTQNLVQLGFKEDDIDFENRGRYGPASISVEVEKGDLPEIGERVLDEIERVVGRSEAQGVRFSVSEEICDQALALARRKAMPKVRESALDLAKALEVSLGGVIGALEFTSDFGRFGPPGFGLDRCGSQLEDPLAVLPFDAEPEIKVSLGLQITYAIVSR